MVVQVWAVVARYFLVLSVLLSFEHTHTLSLSLLYIRYGSAELLERRPMFINRHQWRVLLLSCCYVARPRDVLFLPDIYKKPDGQTWNGSGCVRANAVNCV